MNDPKPPPHGVASVDLQFDDPAQLGGHVAQAQRPLLIGLDIDGVLSPLVDHADDAQLLAGMADVLARLVAREGVTVAAISGRSLDSMKTFGLPDAMDLIGSHGMESDNRPFRPLDEAERARLEALIALANDAAVSAGDGGWVEHKQASVAVHIREADPDSGSKALQQLDIRSSAVPGAATKPGSNVLELFARHASKGTALTELAAQTDAATTVFVGDDVTDEEAFAALGDAGITIKVGTAHTLAAHRLVDPPAVLEFLQALEVACRDSARPT